jgi:hypothetical protein
MLLPILSKPHKQPIVLLQIFCLDRILAFVNGPHPAPRFFEYKIIREVQMQQIHKQPDIPVTLLALRHATLTQLQIIHFQALTVLPLTPLRLKLGQHMPRAPKLLRLFNYPWQILVNPNL